MASTKLREHKTASMCLIRDLNHEMDSYAAQGTLSRSVSDSLIIVTISSPHHTNHTPQHYTGRTCMKSCTLAPEGECVDRS